MYLPQSSLKKNVVFCLLATAIIPRLMAQFQGASQMPFQDKADKIIHLLDKRDFVAVVSSFGKQLKQRMPADKLAATWDDLLRKTGDFVKILDKTGETRQKYQIIHSRSRFAHAVIDIRIIFDFQGKICGLWFVASKYRQSNDMDYFPPDYVDITSFSEKKVQVGQLHGLAGLLSIPARSTMVGVIFINDYKYPDYDKTIGPNKPFRDLAWGLASRGITVLRYEKPRPPEKKNAQPDTIKDAIINDALQAAAWFRKQELVKINKIVFLGHGLGGWILPDIAKLDKKASGLIVLGGNSRPLEDVYVRTLTYLFQLDGKITQEERSKLKKAESKAAVVKKTDFSPDFPSDILPLGLPASYWYDLRKRNPLEIIRDIPDKPILILQGGRDYEVTLDDFYGWKKALAGRKNVTFKLYLKLNHLFMNNGNPNRSSPTEYQNPGHVDAAVIEDIITWLLRLSRQPAKPVG